MELTFLGTASAYPTPKRGVSCVVFQKDGSYWMFDCGEGSQIQLMKSDIRPGKIGKIFISHLHGDHVFGLPGLLCTVSQNGGDDKPPIDIYGPLGLRKFVRVALELSRSELAFSYSVHELLPLPEQFPEKWTDWPVDSSSDDTRLHPNERLGTQIKAAADGTWNLCTADNMTVQAGWLTHRIPSFGFVITELPIPGRLDVQKLKDKGVAPGPLYAKVKSGQTITAPNGELISACDVMGPPVPGRKVVILGDTSNSDHMIPLAMGADVLVHEATLEDEMMENALHKGHSTPGMAARFGEAVKARQLVLTHFSQRYQPDHECSSGVPGEEEITKKAKKKKVPTATLG